MPSVLTKKNSLSFLIGPPIEAAHWLLLANGRGVPVQVVEPVVGVHRAAVPVVHRHCRDTGWCPTWSRS